MTFDSRAYQVEAVDLAVASLEAVGGYAVFCEQRTGKTPIACMIVDRVQPKRLLVVCPEIAIPIWESHLARIGSYTPEYQIVTRDSLWGDRRKLKRWVKQGELDGGTLVLADEGHDFKGKNSKRSRALRMLGRVAQWRLLLTGTPQESGLEDYWPQMDFVDPTLYGEWKFFQARYIIYGGFRNKAIVGYRNEEEFARLLVTRSYRVLLEEVKPTPTNIAPPHEVRFELSDSRSAYDQMERNLIAEVNRTVLAKKLAPDGSVSFVQRNKRVVAPRAITQAMKLHQISGGFLLEEMMGEKLKRVHRFGDEKLEQAGCLMLALGNVPQVYFVRFAPELIRLGQLFTALGRQVTYIAGKKTMKRVPQQERYVSGSPFDIVVAQIKSGVAIDLAYAEEAIMYSWDYSHLTQDQAKMRIRSYHSTRARYHYLIANRTIDEDLFDVVVNKHSFAKMILDKYRRRQIRGRQEKSSEE